MHQKDKIRQILTGPAILTKQNWLYDHALVIDHDKVAALIPNAQLKNYLPATIFTIPTNCYLVPGFIDLHIHGASGFDVMDATSDGLTQIARYLVSEGVTSFLATTMTAPIANINQALSVTANYMKAAAQGVLPGAQLLGLHLEGPFISSAYCGAQNNNWVDLPNLDQMQKWHKLADYAIRMVTLAPELPRADELSAWLTSQGIVVACGHTSASYQQTRVGIDAGCTYATHIFNAMPRLHHREPGAVGALLMEKLITVELIADGMHVHPAIVDLIWRVKGSDGIVLVSDAMRAKGMRDGWYELGGQLVQVVEQCARLPTGGLAGSCLRMAQALTNFMAYTNCSLAQAIRLVTYNPARVLNCEQRKGLIEPGFDADLVILDPDLTVIQTWCAGRIQLAGLGLRGSIGESQIKINDTAKLDSPT